MAIKICDAEKHMLRFASLANRGSSGNRNDNIYCKQNFISHVAFDCVYYHQLY